MLARILVLVTLLGVLFGQVPRSVTICLCTGQVGVIGVSDSDICAKHASPMCSHCQAQKGKKGCFLTKNQGSQTVSETATWLPEIPGILQIPLQMPVRFWQLVIQLRPHLVLPRIREPDQSGHYLRAPPTLA